MHQKAIPIGATIKYGSFVLQQGNISFFSLVSTMFLVDTLIILEFGDLLEQFTKMQMYINGCKKRTAHGYALKDFAVFYLMRSYPEVFASLGRNWDGDENSYCHVRLR